MWFALSAVIMKRKNKFGMSPHFLFLDSPPPSLPKLPEGKSISYCGGIVVPTDDPGCKQ